MEKSDETTAQVVKRLRSEQGLTLDEVARRAGLSESYLWRIEQGTRKPSHDARAKIAQALSVTPDEIAEGESVAGTSTVLDVATAIFNDPGLTQQQKNVVLSVYRELLRGRELA